MAYAPHSKENSNLQHQQQPTKTTAQAFADERESTTAISPLQAMMANNAQQQKLKSTAQLMANSPAQQNLNTTAQSFANQPESIQRMEDEEPLQGEFESEPAQLEAAEALRPNNTGLPDNLKSGIESLSGMSMDHVKVHYNSDKPAQLQAHAYAQGSEIHVAPGQEQHLPHEAWHVVQQAQGRVRPTMQMKAGIGVNDDVGLEQEADVMGAMAIQTVVSNNLLGKPASPALNHTPLQMVACSGGYLAGIFNENNVMNLRVRIGEAAFQHFMTLETNVFSPMVDVFLNQTPILNAAGQVAFLTPLIGNPVQLALVATRGIQPGQCPCIFCLPAPLSQSGGSTARNGERDTYGRSGGYPRCTLYIQIHGYQPKGACRSPYKTRAGRQQRNQRRTSHAGSRSV
jgi:hypothetical protein